MAVGVGFGVAVGAGVGVGLGVVVGVGDGVAVGASVGTGDGVGVEAAEGNGIVSPWPLPSICTDAMDASPALFDETFSGAITHITQKPKSRRN